MLSSILHNPHFLVPFWSTLGASYFLQFICLFDDDGLAVKSKFELTLFLTPFMAILYLLFMAFKAIYAFFIKSFNLPNRTPLDLSKETLEALDIVMGLSFDKLPLYVNHKNSVVREFSRNKLK